jgi:trimeric autotransporter adhesin
LQDITDIPPILARCKTQNSYIIADVKFPGQIEFRTRRICTMRHRTTATLAALLVSSGAISASAAPSIAPIVYIADSQNNRIRAVNTATGMITTVAGNGAGWFSGDGGLATNASLHDPFGVAVDALGNLFIADSQNNRVRMVNRTTGIITTIAGNGTAGFSGDGGPATSAWLWNPTGVAVDGSGNVYIADQRNNRIRMVSGGMITTVAGNGAVGFSGDGGPATSAALYYPTGVAVYGSSSLYIADTNNQRIRVVISGTIGTIAGSGNVGYECGTATVPRGVSPYPAATSVGLHSPTGVALFPAFIAVADSGNECARFFLTGLDFFNYGKGIPSFSGDGGSAISAELNNPTGIAVDQISGNQFIADDVNHRIRMVVRTTTIISTLAGNGAAGFSGDGGPATSARLYNPTGVAVWDPVPAP